MDLGGRQGEFVLPWMSRDQTLTLFYTPQIILIGDAVHPLPPSSFQVRQRQRSAVADCNSELISYCRRVAAKLLRMAPLSRYVSPSREVVTASLALYAPLSACASRESPKLSKRASRSVGSSSRAVRSHSQLSPFYSNALFGTRGAPPVVSPRIQIFSSRKPINSTPSSRRWRCSNAPCSTTTSRHGSWLMGKSRRCWPNCRWTSSSLWESCSSRESRGRRGRAGLQEVCRRLSSRLYCITLLLPIVLHPFTS